MFNFLRSRVGSNALDQPTKQSTAEYLCRLMEEQNLLLRELLIATGHSPTTRRVNAPTPASATIRTDKDVSRVTRQTVVEADRLRQTKQQAPWRTPASGPASASASQNTGTEVPVAGPASPPPPPT